MKFCKYILIATSFAALCGCSSSKKATITRSDSGIKYKILHDAKGTEHAKEGDYVQIFIKTYFGDSLVFDSREQTGGKPVSFPVSKPRFNGDLSEAFFLLTPGDSGIFMVPVDTLAANKQKMQPWMTPGKDIVYAIKLEGIKTLEQVNAEKQEQAKAKGDPKNEEKALAEYFKENNINPEKRPSGLHYVVHTPTNGEKPISGRTVKVNYTGKLLDGTVFDSNAGKAPFSFVLGRGQVILGWDEGIALLKKGEKATLYIPSRLAYGDNSPSPKIPAGSTLIFDVELVDF